MKRKWISPFLEKGNQNIIHSDRSNVSGNMKGQIDPLPVGTDLEQNNWLRVKISTTGKLVIYLETCNVSRYIKADTICSQSDITLDITVSKRRLKGKYIPEISIFF